MTGRSLAELSRAGYITEDWHRWQQGQCGTYALALMRMQPGLRLGVSGITENGDGDASGGWRPVHFYAHDDAHAYDSAGRHPLPYHGVHGSLDYHEHDARPDDWSLPDEESTGESDIKTAQDHARRNGILRNT
jgi:hypothetical protein